MLSCNPPVCHQAVFGFPQLHHSFENPHLLKFHYHAESPAKSHKYGIISK
jgi:hypothetical protein